MHRRAGTMRRISVLGLIGVAGLALFTMSQNPGTVSDDAHVRSDTFWNLSWLTAMEAEGFASLEELTASVDRIVQGRVVAVRPGRDFSNPNGKEVAKYAAITIAVDRALKGPSATTVEIEVFFPSTRRYEAFLSSPPPGETALFFIRNKGTSARANGKDASSIAEEQPFNMLVNLSQSLYRNIDGRVHTQNPAEGDFTNDWEGLMFDDLVDAVVTK